jgi:hypothetical protein
MISIGKSSFQKLLFVLSITAPHTVAAETGACGLEAGMWGKSAAVCALADRPEEAERQFGDGALLRWETGIWVYQGVTCGNFRARYMVRFAQCSLNADGQWERRTYNSIQPEK